MRVVLDTNVLISAVRSNRGPAFRLLSLVGKGQFEICVSAALVFEYESVLKRSTSLRREEQESLLDYLCSVAQCQEIFYLWRPYLRDPGDDLVLELAVASQSTHIVTFNLRDFVSSERFGIHALDPAAFLCKIGD